MDFDKTYRISTLHGVYNYTKNALNLTDGYSDMFRGIIMKVNYWIKLEISSYRVNNEQSTQCGLIGRECVFIRSNTGRLN